MNENERTGLRRSALSSDHLRTFAAIAEAGNLTAAADRLHRTQSAISVQLRKLEECLGAMLFERHVRGMTLTPEGETLLPAARRALAELDRTAALFASPLRGRIRVGIPDDFEDAVLEHLLATFGTRNPNVEVVATSGCTSQYPQAVRIGKLDVAVCSGPEALGGSPLSSEPTVWACARASVPDSEAPVPLALLDRSCWWRDMPATALDGIGRPWRVAYRTGSFASLRSAIRAGLAIGPVPARSIDAGMRILSEAEGFPALPASQRSIHVSASAPAEIAAAMAETIRQAVHANTPLRPAG